MVSPKRLAAVTVLGGTLLFAGPVTGASAQLTQTVTGVAAGSIALSVPVSAVFGSVFAPGSTVSSTLGAITAVSTDPSWTLSAAESGGDGKMARVSAVAPCDTSAATLTNAASLAVAPAIANGSITSTSRTLSGADQIVAEAAAVPLAATVFNTTYTQVIPAAELLASGCSYAMTTTYTLAG